MFIFLYHTYIPAKDNYVCVLFFKKLFDFIKPIFPIFWTSKNLNTILSLCLYHLLLHNYQTNNYFCWSYMYVLISSFLPDLPLLQGCYFGSCVRYTWRFLGLWKSLSSTIGSCLAIRLKISKKLLLFKEPCTFIHWPLKLVM